MRTIGACLCLCLCLSSAWAVDNGQWGDVDPATRTWFKSVKSPHGVPCCDIADGHKTAFKVDAEGHYWVRIEGEDILVPPESIVYGAGNPYEEAIVWYTRTGYGELYIRCFVPVGGV